MLRRAIFPLVLLFPLLALADDKPTEKTEKSEKAEKKANEPLSTGTLGGLKLRSIGPAVTSGRVVGFAVHPKSRDQYYIAVASGGVWKTTNGGTTWSPIFDDQGSYSIGYVALDPKNPNVVWVGTGENNSQRSVGYGDGVYRSDDAGRTWKNVGLKNSEHIGKILIDPRNSDVVYVAAQGPLWGPGGDRGLYKTTDGGKTWKKILEISENTGVTDVVLDPRNPDILLAASYQRRRHVWTLINGGPESALHRSTDGGATWTKIRAGLPTEELGRIGLAVAPSKPDIVYATVESIDRKGGIFRSLDFGVTWERRNDFDAQAQYYAHLVVDPHNAERIYIMNVLIQVSDDGGKTLGRFRERHKHVDNHEIWVDPHDPDFYRVGCDGGIYESHDRGETWKFIANLPITQFYDVAVDLNGPWYNVYGGTQDNNTLGGPAKTRTVNGITNADWFDLKGGDGFHVKVDPKDPNTIYCEMQYGGLVRYDRRTGQSIGIQPQAGAGEPPLRWNWDSPLLISPHRNTRIYFAANKLFRSEDRGNTWKAVSGDLTRQLDRDKLQVMGKLWGADAVSKHVSTSFYGNCVALTESPKKEGLLYVGTDDGLIQITQDGGANWRTVDKFNGVPERTYVSRLLASHHDAETIYASFDNHKNADFAPYLLKSKDAGKTWTSIKGDLPANGSVLAIAEDPVDPRLLFVGTEFGLFVSCNGGEKWIRIKSGLPTIAVRDLAIQPQENDLVVATFGRGFYVLDDYTPLRGLSNEKLAAESILFPARRGLLYLQTRPYGGPGKAWQGDGFYVAENAPYGVTFTYYLKDALKTKKQRRRDAEKKAPAPLYPTKDQLREEAEEEAPAILLTITDLEGKEIRTLTGSVAAGIHRVTWDLREPAANLPRARTDRDDDFGQPPGGPLVLPGTYKVSLSKRVEGAVTPLTGPMEFQVVLDAISQPQAEDAAVLHAFLEKVMRLQRAATGAVESATALTTRLEQIKTAIEHTPAVDRKYRTQIRDLEKKNREILRALRGDSVLRARNENTPDSILERVGTISSELRLTLGRPTNTHQELYRIASKELQEQLTSLRQLLDVDVRNVEKVLDAAGAPWTPGRLPEWKDR